MLEAALIAITLFSLLIATTALYQNHRLKQRFTDTLGDTDSANLEKQLKTYFTKLKTAETGFKNIQHNYAKLVEMAGSSLQKTAIVRFNPFSNTGGDQSFVLAVLDSNDTGYLMTSIHSREGTRVYVKPVEYGSSRHKLSSEEQTALTQAIKNESKGENHDQRSQSR